MVIFISSVRRGLADERDAVAAMITALGHRPSRFEDFTALPVPPRKACLDAVAGADAYLLLLGEHYGDRTPDTGVAPTEEEFNAAAARGLPVIVMRKAVIEMEADQAAFAQRVESYEAGRFRGTFSSTTDLLPKVTAAIKGLEEAPSQVTLEQLDQSPPVPWLGETGRSLPGRGGHSTTLEVHLVPVGGSRLPASALEEGRQKLAAAGRRTGLFSDEQALTVGADTEFVWVAAQGRAASPTGVRLSRSGAVSIWRQLRGDNLGTMISAESLTADIAELVRAGAAVLRSQTPVAVTAGLDPVGMAVEGDTRELGRRTTASISTFAMTGGGSLRLAAEVAAPAAELGRVATDIARELAVRVLQAFRAQA
jgi:hypothetical protein